MAVLRASWWAVSFQGIPPWPLISWRITWGCSDKNLHMLLMAGLCWWLDKRALLTASDLLSQRMAQDGTQSCTWSQDTANEIAVTSASGLWMMMSIGWVLVESQGCGCWNCKRCLNCKRNYSGNSRQCRCENRPCGCRLDGLDLWIWRNVVENWQRWSPTAKVLLIVNGGELCQLGCGTS